MDSRDVLGLIEELRTLKHWRDEIRDSAKGYFGSPESDQKKKVWQLVSRGIELHRGRVEQLRKMGDDHPELRQKFYAAAEALSAEQEITSLLIEIAALVEPAGAVWLGEGRIGIDGKIELLTAVNDQRFIETLLDNQGKAVSSELENAGVTNTSDTAERLRKWKGGILAPYFTIPEGLEGADYSTTIKDGRKRISQE